MVLCESSRIDASLLDEKIRRPVRTWDEGAIAPDDLSIKKATRAMERELIRRALASTDGAHNRGHRPVQTGAAPRRAPRQGHRVARRDRRSGLRPALEQRGVDRDADREHQRARRLAAIRRREPHLAAQRRLSRLLPDHRRPRRPGPPAMVARSRTGALCANARYSSSRDTSSSIRSWGGA
jgi:hypothetical protein